MDSMRRTHQPEAQAGVPVPPAIGKQLSVESPRLAQKLLGFRHGSNYGTQEGVDSF